MKKSSLKVIEKQLARLESEISEMEAYFLRKELSNSEFESGVSKVEAHIVAEKLSNLGLESEVSNVEARLGGFDSIEEKFISSIMDEYLGLIMAAASHFQYTLGDSAIDRDDLVQDSIEYMLRYTLCKVKERSSLSSVWLPFIKKSVRNCFKNLLDYHNRRKRRAVFVTLDSLFDDEPDPSFYTNGLQLEHLSSFASQESQSICADVVSEIRGRLDEVERSVFDLLVSTKDGLPLAKKDVSTSLGIPYAKAGEALDRIRFVAGELFNTC